jgi:RHS repeat-associated protein
VVTWLVTDHLNTPRVGLDNNCVIVWRWNSKGFGDDATDNDPDEIGIDRVVNLRFPGQYYDSESGLYYNYYRDYDPTLGRYIQSDPIGLAGGLNTYGYVYGNPVSYIDPYGNVGILGFVSGAIIGGSTGFASSRAAGGSDVTAVISGGAGALIGGVVGAFNPGGSLVASESVAFAITSAAIAGGTSIVSQTATIALDPSSNVNNFSPSSVIANSALAAGSGVLGPIGRVVIPSLGIVAFEGLKGPIESTFLTPSTRRRIENDTYN